MLRSFFVTTIATALIATGASAATLGGYCEKTDANDGASKATVENAEPACHTMIGDEHVNSYDDFTLEGDRGLRAYQGFDDTTTANGLSISGGSVNGRDFDDGSLQISNPSIGDETTTATLYLFTTILSMVGDFSIYQGDGVALYDEGRSGGRFGFKQR